jgi:glucokinase
MIPGKDVLDEIPFPVLIADIGGTHTRFALVESIDSPVERIPDARTAAYGSLEEAIAGAVYARTKVRPRSAILALAGPIAGEHIHLTNANWKVEPRAIVADLGLQELILLNDFEAISLSLPGLAPDDIDPIGEGTSRESGTRAIIGPGTGLGVGALVRGRESWIPVPGEGGHIDIGPVSARDFAIWPHLEKAHGRISAETLLSGAGLLRLYRGICTSDGVDPQLTMPSDVTDAGLDGADRQAAEALTLFATYLGRMAGDLALIFMARGGVFLAGGIPAKIAPVIRSDTFRAAFVDKAPHRELLDTIPTAIIVKQDPALVGIAAYARAPGRFVVDLAGRRWVAEREPFSVGGGVGLEK